MANGVRRNTLSLRRLDIAVVQLEARVDRLRRRFVFRGEDHFFEVLDDQVAELGDAHDHPVILLHEVFDGLLGVVAFKAQQRGDGALMVKQQAVFGASGEHVQGVAHLPQEFLGRGQQGVFALHQEAFAGQGAQVQRAVLATGTQRIVWISRSPPGEPLTLGSRLYSVSLYLW